jgi:hypothetical protein
VERQAGIWDDQEEGEEPNELEVPVADPDTYRVRLMAQRCDTCIFRPGNLMHLEPGRVKGMVDACVANMGHVTCHDTLAHNDKGLPGAVCRGWEQHPQSANSMFAFWLRGTGLVTLVHADGRLEDADYNALPPYKEDES